MQTEIGYKAICDVAFEIEAYLCRHPKAKDTVRGIAEWWVERKSGEVEQALEMLITHGLITKQGRLYGRASHEHLRPGPPFPRMDA